MDLNRNEAVLSGNERKRKPMDQQNLQSGSDEMATDTQKRQKTHTNGDPSNQNTSTRLDGDSSLSQMHNAEITSLKISLPVTGANSLNVFGRVDVASLRNIMKTNVMSHLLVDCRDAKSYHEKRLCYSLNVPLSSNEDNKCWRFNSKMDVFMFLQERHPNIFGYLHAPGFYKYVIVFDKDSTFKTIPKAMNKFLYGLAKWNENTRTKILLVDGGLEKFMIYCDQTDTCENASIGWTFPALVSKYKKSDVQVEDVESDEQMREAESDNNGSEENASGVNNTEKRVTSYDHTKVFNSGPDDPLSMEHFSRHLENVDSATERIGLLLVAKKQLMSLEGIKLALVQEEHIKSSLLFRQLVGDNLRCSVCQKIYSGKIFQCPNGHGHCEMCIDTATICSKCQTSCNIGTKNLIIIRNTMMEDMVTTMYKVDCPYTSLGCNMKLTIQKLLVHMRTCQRKPENPSLIIIDGYIDLLEKEVSSLNQQLEVYNKRMMKSEQQFFTASTQMTTKLQMQSIEDFKKKVIALNEAKTALMREIFSNGEPVTEKCNIFK